MKSMREQASAEKYQDIYFSLEYAQLYEDENSKAVEYVCENQYGRITNVFLKRTIPFRLNDHETYFDIITPYGYGGPVIQRLTSPEVKKKLIDSYMVDFQKYAEHNNIVSEFVRFHPIIGNGIDFKESYQSIFDRKTVGTTLTYDDVITEEFSKHKRKDIRRILRIPGIRYEIDEEPITLDPFVEIYYSTMERDNAEEFYYFKKEYFQQMLKSFPQNIVTGKVYYMDQLIAMGVYFRYGKYLHAHLSGTLSQYLRYSPAYILKYALALYGHEKGYEVIHYGGGSSRSPDNGLYLFKKEFGKNTEFDFYIAKKIWNAEIYHQLVEKANADKNSEFFPAYRKR